MSKQITDEISRINNEVSGSPKTIFDEFHFQINRRSVGAGLRNDLADIFNQFGRLNELSSHAAFLAEKAKVRRDRVYAIATEAVFSDPRKMNAEAKKKLVYITKVSLDGEITTLIDEEERHTLYSYIASRGKDKVNEISKMLDLGRSILSFDKSEIERVGS